MRRRLRATAVALLVAGVAAVGVSGVSGTTTTDAAWVDREESTGGFAAGTVAPPTGLRCAGSGLLQPVTLAWTAPAGGLTRTGYRWTVTGGLSGTGTLAASATSLVLTNGALGIGSGTFSLHAVGPGGWESTAPTATVSFTTVVVNVVSACSVP